MNTNYPEENQEHQIEVQQEETVTTPTNGGYQTPPPPLYQPAIEKNPIGLTGFILSIVAIFLSWLPIIGWLCWLVGLVLSIVGLFRRPKGFAIAGLIISLIGFVIMFILLGLLGLAFTAAALS
ncbi:hypothetical protein [Myroides odoratus]|jgi:hypothetical protein|uniref:DUF4190 domain-containing protein n=1 Tax=Myroides odoratus TaxID=256 RepID=A0A9Q7E8A8_MYROD|nr:hypothetical protein [Myroides odoratus]EHQ42355.1 hypothetical protein Myrod_1522 [Myroides odoratus DSM 2801]EKB08115.1 hypothetical protein HMPREF9716_01371 [Myroides odoratus CIP 103059]MDR0223576.1 DUF3040 domain-containing protein [Myroides odoratus]QQT99731.1 hypothetical protein I6I88_16405 [Myroides odoratus]WQD58060.1 hypothetical protein U0010_02550 [Myroides odoratus]